ncbi:MAG: hypothetical protein OYM47_20170 [Gemmatimonadota bacterium]|nr:hypothetical protein [Gemmatimonadota bacterium]
MRFLLVLFVLVSSATAQAQAPIPGDLDLDGDVDFDDFLVLASNFGKTGPAPEPDAQQTEGAAVGDTALAATDPLLRADALLGFWSFIWDPEAQSADHFCMGQLSIPAVENDPVIVSGVTDRGVRAEGRWDAETERYVLSYNTNADENVRLFRFTVDEEGNAVGTAHATGENEELMGIGILQPGSGKNTTARGFLRFLGDTQ